MRYFQTMILSLLILLCPSLALAQGTSAAEKTIYLMGEVKMSSPAGQPYGSSVSLVKRTLMPAENKIIEIVASIDARGPVKEYTTIFEIKGAAFSVKDQEGTFSGSGELIGTAWDWSGWKYNVNMLGDNKGTLAAEDIFTNGTLMVKKSFSGPDGKMRILFSEELKPISKAMYELLHAKLLTSVPVK